MKDKYGNPIKRKTEQKGRRTETTFTQKDVLFLSILHDLNSTSSQKPSKIEAILFATILEVFDAAGLGPNEASFSI